jgi:hypothetical protein
MSNSPVTDSSCLEQSNRSGPLRSSPQPLPEVHLLGYLSRPQKFLHDKANDRRHCRSNQSKCDRTQ